MLYTPVTVDTFCQDHLQCLVWLVVVGALDQHVQVCIPQSVLIRHRMYRIQYIMYDRLYSKVSNNTAIVVWDM